MGLSAGTRSGLARFSAGHHQRRRDRAYRRRFLLARIEALEPRLMLASDLLLADPTTDSILRFDGSTGAPLGEFVSSGSGGLVDPIDPTFGPDGNLYVISNAPGNVKVLKYDGTSGAFLDTFIGAGIGSASAIDFGPDDNLYLATISETGVLRYDGTTGGFLGVAASGNGIRRAGGIDFGPDGNLYVLDSDRTIETSADRVLRFNPDTGTLIDEFVSPGELNDAVFLTFGPDNHLYVPDIQQFADVRRFSGTTGEFLGVFTSSPNPSESPIFDIQFALDGYAYAATGEGILRIDSESGELIDNFVEGAGGSITFFPPTGPPTDLELTDLQVPIGAVQGSDLTITYTVTNQSTAATAVNEWEDVLYLSTDDVFDPSDRELGRIPRTTGLSGETSYTETLRTPLPNVSLGDYHVFVLSDRRGMVNDDARFNNLARSVTPLEVVPRLASSHDRDHSLAVGRTLSAYSTAEVVNNELKITYTAFNLTDGYAEATLLTTTLGPDVTFVSSSLTPDQNDQELSWNLGTIIPYGRVSVELTVALAGPNVTQIDTGPQAFATIDTVAVEDELGAAVLRTDSLDSALFAPTADADSVDPFIQAKAAELNQDAAEIFRYLADEIGYESYAGSLRGARGTLWSGAGNSLDEASLGVALMRASGIPARYAQGTLSVPLAQQLIRSMFPERFQVVGYIPDGTDTADPVSAPNLLAETRDHYWLQFDTGSGFSDADTSFADAMIGQTFTAASSTFNEVADALRHKVELTLTAETWSAASAAFGFGDGIGSNVVLTQTLTAAELVGRSISIGNVVMESSLGALIFNSRTTSYTPYLEIGDEAMFPGQQPASILGTPYQEVLTNFPFSSQVVTGLFLNIELTSPTGTAEVFERALFDRIGFAARQRFAGANVNVDPSGPPAFSSTDVWTLKIQASTQNQAAARLAEEYAIDLFDRVNAIAGPSPILQLAAIIAQSRAALAKFSSVSDLESANLASGYSVAAYFDTPRITMFASRLVQVDNRSKLVFEFDLIRDAMRVLATPGQNTEAPRAFAMVRGIFDSFLEAQSVPTLPGSVNFSSALIVQMSMEQGIPLISINQDNVSLLQTLDLPDETKARITANVQNGLGVVVPAKPIDIDGVPRTAWLVGNPVTGEVLSQGQDGGFQGINSFAAAIYIAIYLAAGNLIVSVLSNGVADATGNESLRTNLVKAVAFSFVSVANLLLQQLVNVGITVATSPIGPLRNLDPAVAPILVDLNLPHPTTPGSRAVGSIAVPATLPGATVMVAASTDSLSADQNTAVQFEILAQAGFPDTYELVAEAPEGWTVVVDDTGAVTATPAPGLQSGSYTIDLFARSVTNPRLLAHDEVTIQISSTTPALELNVTPDELFFVEVDGGQLPSVFRVEVRNLGSSPETVEVGVANVPSGFELIQSTPQVTIPPGRHGIVGIHLDPTGPLPPPGTVLEMNVTASNLGGTLIESRTVTFTIPEVHGVRLTLDPVAVTTTPALGAQTVLVVESRGNVAETIQFDLDASVGLTVDGLQTVSLNPGERTELLLTLTPDAGIKLNSSLSAAITANFDGREPVSLTIPVRIAAPGVVSIGEAATSAQVLGHDDLANRLDDLGIALTDLVQTPDSPVFRSQALSNLESIISLLAVDEILVRFADPLSEARDELVQASSSTEVQMAVQNLGSVLDDFGETVSNLAAYNFTLFLTPNAQVAQPQVPARFELLLHHIGLSEATYDIELAGVPAGVSVDVSDGQVTLDRDDFATVVIMLTPTSPDELPAFDFSIDVSVNGLSEVSKSVSGSLTARREYVSIVSVTAEPPFTDAGGVIDVSARLLNAVNREQQARASFVVRDSLGQPVGTPSTPVDVALTVQASLVTLPLGSIDTTSLANGNYSIVVTLVDTNGDPIPGATGLGNFLVGSPITASIDVSPGILPPGTTTVNNTLQIEALAPLVQPPSLLGLVSVTGASDVVRNGDFAYVAGTAGISVFDISGANLADPQFLRVVGSATTFIEMRGNLLVSVLSRPGGGSTRLDTFSLTDPANPVLQGTTGDVPYGSAADFVVTDTHAFVVLVNFVFTASRDIIDQNGGVIAINISNPTAPFFDGDAVSALGTPAGRDGVNDGVLFNENGTNNDGVKTPLGIDQSGGNQHTWGVVQVSPTILLVTGSTATGTDTQSGVGLVRVVDISDPRNMQLVRDLQIPGTVQVLDIASSGNRALITATQGGIADMTPTFPLTGNVVLATLDLTTDPANPTILHQQTLERAARGLDQATALGNGLFAISNIGAVGDQPGLFIVDTNDPDKFSIAGIDAPAAIVSLIGGDGLIFTADSTSMAIYQVPDDSPLTLAGHVPINGGVRGISARDNIAYASSPNGIQVIDYSDPENPFVVGTIPGSHYGARIQDNVLLALRPSGSSFILDVYALQNTPLAPPLIGSSPVINYFLAADFTSSSTHAYVGQFVYCNFLGSNDIYEQLGDLISISLNLDSVENPTTAAPALDNVLSNTHGDSSFDPTDVPGCAENGGDHLVYGVTLANPQTAYLATTTVTGGNTQSGIGRVQVVDVTNSTDPSVVRNLDIPGTVLALSVGISGDVGVVIGTTGGFQDNPAGILTGNLTVTTLDVTDPLDPKILTSQVLDRITSTFWVDFTSLGNGVFAFSNAAFVGDVADPAVIVIDASNPRRPLIGQSPIPFDLTAVKSLGTDGNLLFTTDVSGLSIYTVDPLPGLPVSASVRIPTGNGVAVIPGSFNIPPSEIVSGTGFDTYIFDLTLASSMTSETLQWQSMVTALQPGESRPVTVGTTIDFVFEGTSGQVMLPRTSVAAEQVMSLFPGAQTVKPGEVATYSVVLANPSALDVTYDLSVSGVPASWIDVDSPLTVPAGETATASLRVTSGAFEVAGDYGFVVSATVDGITTSVTATLVLQGEPLLPDAHPESQGVVVSLMPTALIAGQGTETNFVARVFNVGSQPDDFVLFVSGLPVEFQTTSAGGIFLVPPGASNYRDVLMTIMSPAGTTPDDYAFTVTAASVSDVSVTGDTTGLLSVLDLGVDVELTPQSGEPSSTWEMLVTNTGQTIETFDLSVAAPAALVATLGTIEVTLDPGQSVTVAIDVGEIEYALPGSLLLVAAANSRTNPAIGDADSADLEIVARRGLAIGTTPDFVQLPAPGGSSTLLLVNNLGNLEDEFTATVLTTSGPVTASLVTLDGNPAQTIPLFIVPGLSSAAIPLTATLTEFGEGQVTIEVRSLLDTSIVATHTFTITTSELLDYGDAPDGVDVGGVIRQYGTLNSNDGARHVLGSGLMLGIAVDAENDGQSSATADGDGSDDDGVDPIASLVATATEPSIASFLVTTSAAAMLDVWVDLNLNGLFEHPAEHLGGGVSMDLPGGASIVSVPVPAGSIAGFSFARFRLSTSGGLMPGGLASDGEVEDYSVSILSGTTGANASVHLIVGAVEVVAESDQLVARHDGTVVFQTPGSALASIAFAGTGEDDLLSIGNLSSALSLATPLIYHGGDGIDTLELSESGQTLDLSDPVLTQLREIEIVNVVGASPNTLVLDRAGVVASTDSGNTLIVVHDEDDTVRYDGVGWVVLTPIFVDGGQRHLLTDGAATVQTINTRPWTNPLHPTDVNFSGETTALDALQIINFLGRNEALSVPLSTPTSLEELPERYYDVNGSRTATAIDALQVINFIARELLTGQEELLADSQPSDFFTTLAAPPEHRTTAHVENNLRTRAPMEIAIDSLIPRRISWAQRSDDAMTAFSPQPLDVDIVFSQPSPSLGELALEVDLR